MKDPNRIKKSILVWNKIHTQNEFEKHNARYLEIGKILTEPNSKLSDEEKLKLKHEQALISAFGIFLKGCQGLSLDS